jgi:hypothetical protein
MTRTIRRCFSALCALFIVATVTAATPTQVEAWKKQFPVISPGRSPKLYELVSTFQTPVKQATAANVESTVLRLRERANQELLALREKLKSIPAPNPKTLKNPEANPEWFQTTERIQWLEQRLLPFLKRMGG